MTGKAPTKSQARPKVRSWEFVRNQILSMHSDRIFPAELCSDHSLVKTWNAAAERETLSCAPELSIRSLTPRTDKRYKPFSMCALSHSSW